MASVLKNKMLLREAIKMMLLETGTDVLAGEALEAEEATAKANFEKAKSELERWDAENARKTALINRANELNVKLGDNKATKELKKEPKFDYDQKVLQVKRETLVNKLEKTQKEYGAYNPSAISYKRAIPTNAGQKTPAVHMPEPGTKIYLKINDIKPLRWYSWNDPKWSKAVKGIALGSVAEKSGDEKTGVGPGEERLSKILGGKVQGSGVSFDIITPNDQRWEVKALESASSLIRPMAEGRIAFEKPRMQLERILKQIKNFATIVKKIHLDLSDSKEDIAVLQYVTSFIDEEFEMFAKGEISLDRFRSLRAVLKAINNMKKVWEKNLSPSKTELTIGLADKDIPVDQPTFIDVAKRVQRSVPDIDVLNNFQEREIALAALKDPAFSDPTSFFNAWFESVDIDRIFSQVDGVFIINSSGFNLVPKSLFKKAFKFTAVSQLIPKFRFVYYGGVPKIE